jgi:fatty-acyl-CoA synthase
LIETQNAPSAPTIGSAANAWLRALELTAPIPLNPDRTLSTVIEEIASRSGDRPALLSDRECLTYAELVARANHYARWALDQGVTKGDVVGLLMTNRPEYFATWLGITSIGGVVALLNTNLVGPSLAHCINIVNLKHLIVASEFLSTVTAVLPQLAGSPIIWTHGVEHSSFQQIDRNTQQWTGGPLHADEHRQPTIQDLALYIFTSGTTGLPKAANVSHARIMQWSHWFAAMMSVQPADRMYNCLPMYHSVGGVMVPGAILAGGGSVVIREKFSASKFWSDILRWDCTIFQYIGELCRYLLHSAPSALPDNLINHRLRMACGNGLTPEVWESFQERFRIPHIFEFYAATEGGVSLFNVQGKPGAIGHIPGYLAHRLSPPLIKFDVAKGEPVRNDKGFCIRCATNEVGEAIGKIVDDISAVGVRFEGYTDEHASEKKILRNVFESGDAWVRTGDLMRKDSKGFFYFVDRIGDTFRWKGENVSTSEVSDALCSFSGVEHANVYGVPIPGTEGRIGMAALVTDSALDLAALRSHLVNCLPAYAQPAFLRICSDIEVTGTFKYSKTDLVRQGYDPALTSDVIYFDNPESQTFDRLDSSLFERIQSGEIKL